MPLGITEREMGFLLDRVKHNRGIDFGTYQPSILTRRLLHRLHLTRCPSAWEYVALLNSDPSEYDHLSACLAIKVSEFFRDAKDSVVQARRLEPSLVDEVFVAKNGAIARERIRQEVPDLLISNVMMPEMEGYELCAAIRADHDLDALPVTLVTTISSSRDVLRAIAYRGDASLPKPYSDRGLLAIEHVLANRARREKHLASETISFSLQDDEFEIQASPQRIIDLLLSMYQAAQERAEALTEANLRLQETGETLRQLNESLEERVRDRTDRIRHLSRLLHARRDINTLIVREKDETTLLQGACDALVVRGELRTASIHLAGSDGSAAPLESRTSEPERRLAIETQETRASGHLSFSIAHEDCSYGDLTVSTSAEDAADSEVLFLLEEVASDLGYALHGLEVERDRAEAQQALHENEERYRKLADSVTDVFFALDREHRCIYWNRASQELTGVSANDVLGRELDGLFWAALRTQTSRDAWVRAFETPHSETFISELRLAGRDLLYETRIYPAEEGTSVIARDVTELRQAEEARQTSEKKYRMLFERNTAGVYVSTLDGHLLDCNRAFSDLLGYDSPQDALAHQDALRCFDAADRKHWIETLKSDGEPSGRESRLRRKDGRILWVIESASLIPGDSIGQQTIQGTLVDVSRLRETEQSLRERVKELTCLFQVNRELQTGHILESLTRRVAELLPAGMTFVEDAEALVELNGARYPTRGYDISRAPGVHADIRASESVYGRVSVQYSRPLPFIPEEQDLLNSIALSLAMWYEQHRAQDRLKKALDGTVQAIGLTAEMKDSYTTGHQRRVAQLACAIGSRLGLSNRELDDLRIAALIHDVGKMAVPAEILSKPGRLTSVEFDILREHPRTAYDMLVAVEFPEPVPTIVLQHHERINGSGYPQGLRGAEIVLASRILAVSDVVEAMASHRPYRPALGIERALGEIERGRGSVYDVQVANACLRVFADREITFDTN